MSVHRLRPLNGTELLAADAPVLQVKPERPIYSGAGSLTYVCGRCEAVLAERMDDGQLAGAFIRCYRCQSVTAVGGTRLVERRSAPRFSRAPFDGEAEAGAGGRSPGPARRV